MCFLNSFCLHIIIFHTLSVILCSTGDNTGPGFEPKMKQLVSGTADPSDYEKASRGSGKEENNNNNNQISPPQLIAAVEFQIVRELQKMVISNVEKSDEAAAALFEIKSCMENGMSFTDAVHEGLGKMFPDIVGQQNSANEEGTMLAMILFTNVKKYMQEVYILNLLQQQMKEYGHANEVRTSSINRNSNVAGTRPLQYPGSLKPAMIENSENDENEVANIETSVINSSATRKNNSSQSATSQLAKSTSKTKFDQEQTNATTPPNAFQMNRNLSQNKVRQQEEVSSQSVSSQSSNYALKNQRQPIQNKTSNSSTTIQLSSNDAAKNKNGLQQGKFTQNISGENTLTDDKSVPLMRESQVPVERTAQKSDLAGVSNIMHNWLSNLREFSQRYQETIDNNSSMETDGEERYDNDSDLKKEQMIPISFDHGRVYTEKSSVQNTSRKSEKDQQYNNSNTSSLGPSTQTVKNTINGKSQVSREKVAEESTARLSNQLNKMISNIHDSLQQYQGTNDDDSSIKITREEKQNSVSGLKQKQEFPTPIDAGPVDSEKSSSQKTLKMSNQDQPIRNSIGFPRGPSTQQKKVTEQSLRGKTESQFLSDQAANGNVIRTDLQNQKMSRVEQAEAKPSLNQRPSAVVKIMEPKRVEQSSPTISSPTKTMETKGLSRNNMSEIIKESASSSKPEPRIPQFGNKKPEVEQMRGRLPQRDNVNVDQTQDQKKLVLKSSQMNKSDRTEDLSLNTGGEKVSSQQRIYKQQKKGEHEDLVDDRSISSGKTRPAENIGSETAKRQIFRTETPSVRTYPSIPRNSELAKEPIQNPDKEYGKEKGYPGNLSIYGDRQDYQGKEINKESRGMVDYKGARENNEFGMSERYEGIGRNDIQGQQWNSDALVTSSSKKVSESAFESRSAPSNFWHLQKSIAARSFPQITKNSTMNPSDNRGTVNRTAKEQRSSSYNGKTTGKLMESVFQPEDQKWQRRVVKIVEKSKPSGEIVRTITRSGNWSSDDNPSSFEELTPTGLEKSIDNPFFQQAEENGIAGMDNVTQEIKESIFTNNIDTPWDIIKRTNKIKQKSSISSRDETVTSGPPIAGRWNYARSGFVSSNIKIL